MLSENDLVCLLSVPTHYRGFPALLNSLQLAVQDETLLDPISRKLYPYIAERHGTTVSRVKRNIRYLIEVWWKRGNRSFAPDYITSRKKPPGNKMFIYALVVYLLHENEKEQ